MNDNGQHYRTVELARLIETGRDPDEIVRSDTHLGRCPECRGVLMQLGRIESGLRDIPLTRPGEDFTKNVMARVERYARSPAGYRAITKGASVLIAVMGLMFVVAGYLAVGFLWAPAQESSLTIAIRDIVTRFGDAVRWGGDWLGLNFGRNAGGTTANTWIFAAAGGIALIALDWILSRRLAQRAPRTPS